MMMKSAAADFFPFKACDLSPKLCEFGLDVCELMTNACDFTLIPCDNRGKACDFRLIPCDFQASVFDSHQSIKNNEMVGIGMPIPYTFQYLVPGISIMDILNGV